MASVQELFTSTSFDFNWFVGRTKSLELDNLPIRNVSLFVKQATAIVKTLSSRNTQISFTPDSTSYSINTTTRKEVKISMAPFLDSINNDTAFEVIMGVTIHELAHILYTDYSLETYRFNSQLLPFKNKIFSQILNILEDKRIESLVSRNYPGYAKYLASARKYYNLSGTMSDKKSNSPEYRKDIAFMQVLTYRVLYSNIKGEATCSKQFINDRDAILKQFEKYMQKWMSKEDLKLFDTLSSSFTTNMEDEIRVALALSALYQKYCNSTKTINMKDSSKKIRVVLSTPGIPSNSESSNSGESNEGTIEISVPSVTSESTECSISDNSAKDPKRNSADEALIKASTSGALKKLQSVAKAINSLIEAMKDSSHRMIEESLIEDDMSLDTTITWTRADSVPVIEDYKQLCNPIKSLSGYISRVQGKLNQSFELSEGEVDEDELYNTHHSRDVFFESSRGKGLCQEIIILQDASGSMSCPYNKECTRMEYSVRILKALAEGLSANKSVRLGIYAHTADKEAHKSTDLIEVHDINSQNKVDLGKIQSLKAMDNNRDSVAILEVAKKFSKRSGKKLLIIISDGDPAASSYSGAPAIQAVKEAVQLLESKNIMVLSIAVASLTHQKEMYKHFIPASDKVAQDVSKWMQRYLRASIVK